MRLLFFGTPETAVPFLEESARTQQVVAAVTQPDKPAGRGLALKPSPVKAKARELGIPVFDPDKPSTLCGALGELKPDLAVVVAYGKLLKKDLLAVPRLGMLNVHFSLLPKYRGAAPVQWSLVRGEARSGVTLFWLDEGMDTGPVFSQRECPVGVDEDAPGLLKKLTDAGVVVLREALAEIAAGGVRRSPQTGVPSMAPKIKREDARIGLNRPAAEIHNLVRGMRLWPRAYLDLIQPKQRVLVLKTSLPVAVPGAKGNPVGAMAHERPLVGRILRVEPGKGILIECGDGSSLWFLDVQPEGKSPIPAADFLNGLRLDSGDILRTDREGI